MGGACVFLLTAQHAGGNDGAPCGRCFRGVAGASPPLHCVSGDLSFFGDDEVGRAQLSSLSRPSSNQVASSRSPPHRLLPSAESARQLAVLPELGLSQCPG